VVSTSAGFISFKKSNERFYMVRVLNKIFRIFNVALRMSELDNSKIGSKAVCSESDNEASIHTHTRVKFLISQAAIERS
jgi:hypothetical protein